LTVSLADLLGETRKEDGEKKKRTWEGKEIRKKVGVKGTTEE